MQNGLDNPTCAVTFLLHYFFNTATQLWVLNMSLSWAAEIVFRAQECAHQTGHYDGTHRGMLARVLLCCIQTNSPSTPQSNQNNTCIWRHVLAWTPTGLLSASVFVLRAVEPNELLGICELGLHRYHPVMQPYFNGQVVNAGISSRYYLITILTTAPPLLCGVIILIILCQACVLLFHLARHDHRGAFHRNLQLKHNNKINRIAFREVGQYDATKINVQYNDFELSTESHRSPSEFRRSERPIHPTKEAASAIPVERNNFVCCIFCVLMVEKAI